jgi:hypothetical protein
MDRVVFVGAAFTVLAAAMASAGCHSSTDDAHTDEAQTDDRPTLKESCVKVCLRCNGLNGCDKEICNPNPQAGLEIQCGFICDEAIKSPQGRCPQQAVAKVQCIVSQTSCAAIWPSCKAEFEALGACNNAYCAAHPGSCSD